MWLKVFISFDFVLKIAFFKENLVNYLRFNWLTPNLAKIDEKLVLRGHTLIT